jgi:hypothetical protein
MSSDSDVAGLSWESCTVDISNIESQGCEVVPSRIATITPAVELKIELTIPHTAYLV